MGGTQRVKRQARDSQSCWMLRRRAFRSSALQLGQFPNDERNARESRRGDDTAKPNVQAPNTIDTRLANTTAHGCSKGGRRFQ